MKDEPIEVEELVVCGGRLTIRHFAPRYDSLTFDTVDTATGPLHLARVGQFGYATHEPMYPSFAQSNRAGRRANRSKKRGRR